MARAEVRAGFGGCDERGVGDTGGRLSGGCAKTDGAAEVDALDGPDVAVTGRWSELAEQPPTTATNAAAIAHRPTSRIPPACHGGSWGTQSVPRLTVFETDLGKR